MQKLKKKLRDGTLKFLKSLDAFCGCGLKVKSKYDAPKEINGAELILSLLRKK